MKKKIHYEFTATEGKDGHYECLYEPILFQSEPSSKSNVVENELQIVNDYMSLYSDVNKLFYEVYYRNFQRQCNGQHDKHQQEMIAIQNMILNKLKF